jgi:hypothetical protein
MYGAFEERSKPEDVVRERFEEDDGIMLLAFDPTHGRVTLLVENAGSPQSARDLALDAADRFVSEGGVDWEVLEPTELS